MVCNNCGNEVSENAKFCRNCGSEVKNEIQEKQSNKKCCPNCGTDINPGAAFCKECGTALSSNVEVQQVPTNQMSTPDAPKETKNNKSMIILISVLIAVILVCAGTVGTVWYMNNADNDTEISETDKSSDDDKEDEDDDDDEEDADKKGKKNKKKSDGEDSEDSFNMTVDEDGNLVDVDGNLILDENGNPMNINLVEDATSSSESTNDNSKQAEFTARAQEIEEYSETAYTTALSQTEMNEVAYNEFIKWDVLLNEVYQYLKATMPADEFSELENDEIDWIVEKEAAIDAVEAEWEGGSAQSMMMNDTASMYTKDRCYYLISLVKD